MKIDIQLPLNSNIYNARLIVETQQENLTLPQLQYVNNIVTKVVKTVDSFGAPPRAPTTYTPRSKNRITESEAREILTTYRALDTFEEKQTFFAQYGYDRPQRGYNFIYVLRKRFPHLVGETQ